MIEKVLDDAMLSVKISLESTILMPHGAERRSDMGYDRSVR
jgi:hypothetical protein